MGKPWARYEVGYINHDKFRAIPANAICLWLEGKNYADAKSTDGLLPAYEVKHWRFYSKTNVTILTTSCGVKPGTDAPYAALWEAHPVGFKMHDYLDYNDCRDVVTARIARVGDEREWDRRRKQLYRDQAFLEAVRTRDGDCCRYCGQPVNWADRRGPKGANYDHVEPRGANTFENIVVSCRGCNSTKGNRSLEVAGMALRPVPHLVQIQSGPVPDLARGPDIQSESQIVQRHTENRKQKTDPKETNTQERVGVVRNGHDAGSAEWPDGWMADLESRWKAIYAKVKHGAPFFFNWRRDEDPAHAVQERYGANLPRLDKMLEIFFLMDPREVKNVPGTPAQFLLQAPEIDSRLRQEGQ